MAAVCYDGDGDQRCAVAVTEEEGGGGGQRGRGGWVGMQEEWARWMVTAGGGGRRLQQGWRVNP